MPESIFSHVLVKAAQLTQGVKPGQVVTVIDEPEPVEKEAFVDAGMATGAGGGQPAGGDPSQMGGPPPSGGAPPDPSQMGGAPPPDPSQMGGPPPGGDPISGKLDQVLAQLQMQPPGGAMGGAPKPPGGGGKKGGGGEMQYNIILKLLARMCDHMNIPVSLEELLTQEQQIAAFQAQSAAGQPAAGAAPPAAGGAPAGGGSGLLGDIPPPSTVAPLSSVTGGQAGGAAPAGGGAPPPGKTASFAGYDAIAVTPEALHSVELPAKTAQAPKRPRDIFQVLRDRR